MADLTRAEERILAIDRDPAFRAAIEAPTTAAAKREGLDARGYQDVGLDDMKPYVESKGGTLVVPGGGRELNEQELAAVAGGAGDTEAIAIGHGVGAGAAVITVAAVAAVV